jgi:hypothetical protein
MAACYGFLMAVPCKGRKADHPKGPGGTRVFHMAQRSSWGRYTLQDKDKRKATVSICVKCRNRRGERGKHGREALVYTYGGGLKPSSYQRVKETYRSRFAIETSYRQLQQARIRTSTRGGQASPHSGACRGSSGPIGRWHGAKSGKSGLGGLAVLTVAAGAVG